MHVADFANALVEREASRLTGSVLDREIRHVASVSDGAVAVAASSPPAEPAPSRPRPAGRRALQNALFAAPILGFVAAGWAHRALTEDAFIYLRVVRQIRAGHGPVFNVGARVEAFTGPLWLFILTVADFVAPVRLEWLAVALSLAFGAAGVALAMLGARRLWAGPAPNALFVPFGALAFVVLLPVWIYSTNGLEAGLVFAWLGASLWILAGWARDTGRLSTAYAVVLGLGWLIRPEMAAFSALFFVLILAGERRHATRRDQLRVALAMVALPLAYQIFRMGYYGSLVPNTAVAKEGAQTNWSRGMRYLRDFVDPYWLWVLVLALVAGGYVPFATAVRRGSRAFWVAASYVIGGILLVVYVIAIGGDYLHARLLLPSLFAICAPVAAIPATRRHLAGLLLVPWAFAAAVSLKPDQYKGNFLAHGFEVTLPSGYHLVTVDDYGWGRDGQWRRWYRGPGFYQEVGALRYIRTDVPLAPKVRLPFGAFYGVGVSSYALGVDFSVLDRLGLADSFTAHLEVPTTPSNVVVFAGHEKPLPAPWLAARVTRSGTTLDASSFASQFRSLIPLTTGEAFEEQVAWARAALRCPGIARLASASDSSMTLGRFVSNFTHALANTRTRIPADPEAAYRKFCGTGTPAEVRSLRSG